MASVRPLTDLTVADLWREVKDPATLWGGVSQQTLRTVKLLLENRMHDELHAYLHAGRYVRDHGRVGYRNGVYRRHLTTTWGTIPDLQIPRARDAGFQPSVVARYQPRTDQVNRLVHAVFLGGLSTRRVGPILAPLLGDTVSPATVSKITQALDQAVAAFHVRRLADHYRYLFLDAVTLRVKTPDGTRRRHALVAYGLTATGRRELLDYRLVRQECQATWEPFLINLACQGLTGAALRLITTDGHASLHAALPLVYPQVPRQACWVHVLRNVRTTNAIERAFREVRRRTRPMSCFTNTASCDRIMFAVIWAFNQHAAGRPLSWESTQKP
ncbi:MAG TPA: transposase [bacterium]|nr:transposase [bacterium]